MRAFLDTSVLVATFLGDHPNHSSSLDLFLRLTSKTGFCAAHSLAEVYATVTRLPGRHRVGGDQAVLFLDEIRNRLSLVALDGDSYYKVLSQAADARVVGGAVYDALIAQCAVQARASSLYTLNQRHFAALPSLGNIPLRVP
ncbi:MAG: PIN domain-containing protein [Acidobacteriales bacterium]|nr:PIN domain-containing protein [Terriglobales bacterium]